MSRPCKACSCQAADRPIGTLFGHLCDDCLREAIRKAKEIRALIEDFKKDYTYNTTFILEMGDWALKKPR